MQIPDNSHIAIIQTAFIGDIVLSLPVVQSIKLANPSCKITFITTPQAVHLVEVCTSVDSVISFDKRNNHSGIKKLFSFIAELNELKFDFVISLHRSIRTSFLVSRLNNCIKIGYKNSAMSFVYNYKVKYYKHLHEIERNYELLNYFENIKYVSINDVETKIKSDDINNLNLLLNQKNISSERILILAAGSVWETKRWKKEYFAELAEKLTYLGYQVVLTGSPADLEICEYISKNSKAINLAGKTNIPQTLYLIKLAKLVITNDSAPTHFAGLMNTPVITIYGPTSPIFGFGPRSEISSVIRNENLKCSPCRIHGSKNCPIGTHICMKSISVEQIFNESIKLLK
jgi:heptosyltransferase-2